VSILIDLTIRSNRTDKVTLDKTFKEACVAAAAVFNSHNLRSAKTGKVQKSTDFKREVIKNNMATDNGLYNTISTFHNGYYPKQIALQFEMLNLRPALYSVKQKTVIFNACLIVRMFLAGQ
jgi:hypothetical protein